jgi:hypothetical protein
MKALTIKGDGTTTIELTDREAHELRDLLANQSGSGAARKLQRLLSHAHGDTEK